MSIIYRIHSVFSLPSGLRLLPFEFVLSTRSQTLLAANAFGFQPEYAQRCTPPPPPLPLLSDLALNLLVYLVSLDLSLTFGLLSLFLLFLVFYRRHTISRSSASRFLSVEAEAVME
jgi:hypothetical protein